MKAWRIDAPFTAEQVRNLRLWQQNDNVHPFTCCDHQTLVVTKAGFKCPKCKTLQTWCHAFMAEPQPLKVDLFVILFDGQFITPKLLKKIWTNYGSAGNTLQGWRPPKKVYYSLAVAKAQMRWIAKYAPQEFVELVQIHRFASVEVVK